MGEGKQTKLLSIAGTFALIFIISNSFTLNSDSEEFLSSKKTISAMTYNIRFDDPEDKNFNWEERKLMVSQTISSNTPDIMGIQEAYYNQIKWLESELEIYNWYAVGSDDGEFRGEHCAIFYNHNKYEKINAGTYWLSEELDKPGSLSWDAKEPSVLSWVKLKVNVTGDEIFVFNTRLASSEKAIVEGGKVILEKIKSLAGDDSFILTGDFNEEPDHQTVKLLSSTFKEAKNNSFIKSSSVDYTYVGYDNDQDSRKIQDYVFFSKDFPVNSYEVLNTKYNEKYPSDHLPVLCRLRLP